MMFDFFLFFLPHKLKHMPYACPNASPFCAVRQIQNFCYILLLDKYFVPSPSQPFPLSQGHFQAGRSDAPRCSAAISTAGACARSSKRSFKHFLGILWLCWKLLLRITHFYIFLITLETNCAISEWKWRGNNIPSNLTVLL